MTNFTDSQIQTLEKSGTIYHINSVPFHATAEEWEDIDYIPQKGEIVIYDEDDENELPRMKLGDGENYVRDLAFFATASEGGDSPSDVTGGLAYELLWENDNITGNQLVAFPSTALSLSPDYDCYDVVLMSSLHNVVTIRVYHGTETTAERVKSVEGGIGIERRVVWYDADQGKMRIGPLEVEAEPRPLIPC